MRTKLFLLALGLAIISALGMFHIKYTVVDLEADKRRIERAINLERDLIQTRRADLALLTRPQRLARHAATLGMMPAQDSRIVVAEQVGRRADMALAGQVRPITLPSGGSGSISLKPINRIQIETLMDGAH